MSQRPEPLLRGVKYRYKSSADGVDANCLLLLHGLGDCAAPFARLGASLNLPQTAVLALDAPLRIPLLDENNLMWWPSFDLTTGDVLPRADPREAITLLHQVMEQLTALGWPAKSIHVFGFGQGGSLALQALLQLPESLQLGSVVSICGGLLSAPASGSRAVTSTPILLAGRQGDKAIRLHDIIATLGTAARSLTWEAVGGGTQAMPRGRAEWEPIMRFWSERLRSRPRFPDGEQIVEL